MEEKNNDDFLTSYYEHFKFENKQRIKIENREELLSKMNILRGLTTGRLDVLYTNNFISETIEMLINSLFLYEDGYFDCAFYSVRESYEIMNSMLYLAKGNKQDIQNWIGKEKFPMNSELKRNLSDSKKFNDFLVTTYEEVKKAIPDFFKEQDDLEKIVNKIIHKQGLDNFYILRRSLMIDQKFVKDDEIKLFENYLKHTIGMVLILFIILDPLSLALSDEEIYMRTHFDPITTPINFENYEDCIPVETIEKIKKTSFYQNFIQQFLTQEKMNEATANLIKNQFFDINRLDQIKEQKHLLSVLQKYELEILEKGLKISVFNNNTLLGDWTSIKSNYNRSVWSSNEFDDYKKGQEEFNQSYNGVFISYVKVLDTDLFIEHNSKFSIKETETIQDITKKYNEQFGFRSR